jgi:putative oxidoreductase
MIERTISTRPENTYLLIRLMVGLIFLFEGIQKFLFPQLRGAGQFEQIGLPFPEFLSYFVATFEVLCGTLILIGFLTRLAAVPLLIIMLVAIFTTKLPIFHEEGFWFMVYLSKTDFAMFLGSLFLLINGAGSLSVDHIMESNRKTVPEPAVTETVP